jgi:hypothetical protein
MGRIIPADRPYTTTIKGKQRNGFLKATLLEQGRLLAITNTGDSTIDGSRFASAKFGLAPGEVKRVIGYAENADYLVGLKVGSMVDAYIDYTGYGSYRLSEVINTVVPVEPEPQTAPAAGEETQD